MTNPVPPIIWSIAGTDSGGGAGLGADQRAADAFGVHLCPVVAAVTAQHSRAVTHVEPLSAALIDAQLRALADDMPPKVIKTGLLGGAEQVRTVARWVDRLRESGPLALVVDPVLGATSGSSFADASTLRAYRDELLPRATVITPNGPEAWRLLDDAATTQPDDAAVAPELARRLRAAGVGAVCITGGDENTGDQVLDWVDTSQARGWLSLPRVITPHHHGTGCTFAASLAAALALGFVAADAAVLAKMATTHALRRGHRAGLGCGPVKAAAGFATNSSLLPQMSWGELIHVVTPMPVVARPLGLYAIVDSALRVEQVLASGVRTVQLRIKTLGAPDTAWHAYLRDAITRSVAACRAAGAELFINDHWEVAQTLGADGVHLGQEDLLAMGDDGRRALRVSGLSVGVSSHSLWELCRARTLAPRYVACGPVWPTLTKTMPWRAQGLVNLAWWIRMAGAPVAAIGGILNAEQVKAAASYGADGVCVVRALTDDPARTVPALQYALESGLGELVAAMPDLPHPSLESDLIPEHPFLQGRIT